MDPIDSNQDLELIAAFIDGRLSAEERARVVKLLAESDEALELFAHTVRHQPDRPDLKLIPGTSARTAPKPRWRQWTVIAPVAAAAALAIVMVPTLRHREPAVEGASAYVVALTGDPHFTAGLEPGWDQRWAATRGNGEASADAPGTPAVGSARESELAFRLGVRSVDLQVALVRGDVALAQHLTREIIDALDGIAFSDMVGARYHDLEARLATADRAQSIDQASTAERGIRDLLGANLSASYEFGQWAGAAQLAAQTRDTAFLTSHRAMEARFARSAGASDGTPGSLGAEDLDAIRTIDSHLEAGLTDSTLDQVQQLLRSLIRRRGG